MNLAVITPIGPGHHHCATTAMASVNAARERPGPFSSVRHIVIDDGAGTLGRGAARNLGMVEDADWYFFLDADDMMRPDALQAFPSGSQQAVFGAISLSG